MGYSQGAGPACALLGFCLSLGKSPLQEFLPPAGPKLVGGAELNPNLGGQRVTAEVELHVTTEQGMLDTGPGVYVIPVQQKPMDRENGPRKGVRVYRPPKHAAMLREQLVSGGPLGAKPASQKTKKCISPDCGRP